MSLFFSFSYIVPPQKPKILNERGEIIQSLAGPYDEGSDLVLLCEVRGGTPAPRVTWSWKGKPLDSTMLDFSFPSSQTSKLVIKNLSRAHQHAILTCHASNFPKTEVVSNVTIDLLCKYTRFLMIPHRSKVILSLSNVSHRLSQFCFSFLCSDNDGFNAF